LGITRSGMHEPLPMIFEMIMFSPIPFVLNSWIFTKNKDF